MENFPHPEATGPLTQEQHTYLQESGFGDESLYELCEEVKYYSRIVDSMSEGDIAYPRMKQQLDLFCLIRDLRRRLDEHGVSDIIELTEPFVKPGV